MVTKEGDAKMTDEQAPIQKDWDEIAAETLSPIYYESYSLWLAIAQKKYEAAVEQAQMAFDGLTRAALSRYDRECHAAYLDCRDAVRKRNATGDGTFRSLCSPGQKEWDELLALEERAKQAYEDDTKEQRATHREAVEDAANKILAESAIQVAHLINLQAKGT